ncbi:uncharacterized protein L969DRAFT_84341 [Mixia osmundae IAM 14324]|uniref:Protein disulfide-isomerase n=1 Tax=Mixia osmundae (strain CBS 9802 / IAM 14324 / JCM 22182 / KY 12970) TaxID=764103 RepID=G7E347_MIXOS|nr:uncharacterized protein L969DRAFT_84341 [Mixia osmundae IAM 14324]KEI42487.1 hypothetical protein L969DRAFT_84341 [Mixia osmundae IAM 14324]GAA97228.1 hypothetical protein E5Q_03904 [Mixia osmundae IAM 14324]
MRGLVFAALAAVAAASDVLELGKDTFRSTVDSSDLLLAEFFAPWCGHCKALAPHYEEAATALKESNIKLAKIDCTQEADLCAELGVNGYPTLKVFRNGKEADYAGTREAPGIISYMKKQALPAVSDVTSSNHDEFSKTDKVVIIAYLDSTDTEHKETFTKFANTHRDSYVFGLTHDSSLAGASGAKIVLHKSFDEGRNDFPSSSFTEDSLLEFVKTYDTPLLDEISPDNFAKYAESGLPLAYVFVERTDESREALVKSLEPLAREVKGKVNLVWIDALKFGDHAKSLNLEDAKWPAFAIQDVQEATKFPLDQSLTVDPENVGAFVRKYLKGEIEPSIKSEAVPATQDESVYVLVTSEFEKVALDDSKDVFLEIYAPWCGHCKRLKPIWEQLADQFSEHKDKFLVAKLDGTANDIPPTAGGKIAGFPTIRFKPAGSKEWIEYEGDRSIEDLISFAESKSANQVKSKGDLPTFEAEGSGDEASDDEEEAAHDEL